MRGVAILLAAMVLGLSPRSAQAVDVNTPLVAAPWTWSGFYAGVTIGYGFGTVSNVVVADPFTVSLDTENTGFIGGAFVGYNFAVTPWIVLGVEGDISGTNITGITGVKQKFGTIPTAFEVQNDLNWLGTLRGRVGITPLPQLMIYGTGGVAWGGVESRVAASIGSSSLNSSFATEESVSEVNSGWVVGAGAEFAVTRNILVRGEYLRVDLGRSTTFELSAPHTYDILRGGIAWKF